MGKNKLKSSKLRVRRCRDKKTEEEKAECREKDRINSSKKRLERTEEEKALHRKKDKERKAKRRHEIKEQAKKETIDGYKRAFNRKQQQKRRKKMPDVKREYERIEQLLRNRKARAERDGKTHLLDNLKAKKGMQRLKEDGRTKKFDMRPLYKMSEVNIWKQYRELGAGYKKWLEIKNPDMSKIFDEADAKLEKEKEEKEQKKKEKEKRKEEEKKKEDENNSDEPDGYWGVQHGDWYWYGKGSPPPAEIIPSWEPTEEEEKRMEEERLKAYELYFKELADERKKEEQKKKEEGIIKRRECQKRYYRKKKKALQDQVVEMPELGEKSAYQLLQEKNIEELEQRKKASGLFDDD